MPTVFLLVKPDWATNPWPNERTELSPQERVTALVELPLREATCNAVKAVDQTNLSIEQVAVYTLVVLPTSSSNTGDWYIRIEPAEIEGDPVDRADRRSAIWQHVHDSLEQWFASHPNWPHPAYDLEVLPLDGSGASISRQGKIGPSWGTRRETARTRRHNWLIGEYTPKT